MKELEAKVRKPEKEVKRLAKSRAEEKTMRKRQWQCDQKTQFML